MPISIEDRIKEADMQLNYILMDCLKYLNEKERFLLCQANAYWIDFVNLECEIVSFRYAEGTTEKQTASGWRRLTLINHRITDIKAIIYDRIPHSIP
jgi:uncharacterized protein YecT (DUF1311 family)